MSTELKARILDLQDENVQLKQGIQRAQETLMKVVEAFNIQPDENGQITYETIEAALPQPPKVEQVTE